jgi:bisanhydrobacterioruberin hydratase
VGYRCMTGGVSIRNLNIHGLLQQKVALATGIAILVHAVGLLGMAGINRAWFVSLTPLNLLLMSLLLVWTQDGKGANFYRFLFLAFITGMAVEITGVNTGLLFGNYEYSGVLGPGLAGVPLVIGMNWFVVMIAAASFHQKLWSRAGSRLLPSTGRLFSRLPWSFELVGISVLAVLFDWIMEPSANLLGFWTWAGDGAIPSFNYVCWFFVSLFLVSSMRTLRVQASNNFAANLFIIQLVFFLLTRILL